MERRHLAAGVHTHTYQDSVCRSLSLRFSSSGTVVSLSLCLVFCHYFSFHLFPCHCLSSCVFLSFSLVLWHSLTASVYVYYPLSCLISSVVLCLCLTFSIPVSHPLSLTPSHAVSSSVTCLRATRSSLLYHSSLAPPIKSSILRLRMITWLGFDYLFHGL